MRKLSNKEIDKVYNKAASAFDSSNGVLRWGQAFFNALYELFPDVADGIRATENDPFYDSEKIIKCIDFISEENGK